MAGREAARAEAREAGRTPKATTRGPDVDAMSAAGRIQRTREDSRRRLAETERRDAGD
jgi:hypothetical protein